MMDIDSNPESMSTLDLPTWISNHASPVTHDPLILRWQSAWKNETPVLTKCDVRREADQAIGVEVPSQCWTIKGFRGEFVDMQTTSIYVRDDYYHILRQMLAFLQDKGVATSPTSHDINEEGTLPNPFSKCEFKRLAPIILTGSPGTGKSLFLRFLLALRLNARLPTIFQKAPRAFYLFTEFGVHLVDTTGFDKDSNPAYMLATLIPDAWYLLDSNRVLVAPPLFVDYMPLTIVEAASPRKDRMSWLDKHSRANKKYCMQPWDLEEAIIAAQFQLYRPPTERQLQYWFEHFAPSVRRAFQNAADPTNYEAQLDEELTELSRSSNLQKLVTETLGFSAWDDLRHKILTYIPTHHSTKWSRAITPGYMVEKAITLVDAVREEERANYYQMCMGVPTMAPLAGHLFEQLFLAAVRNGKSWLLKKLIAEPKDTNQHLAASTGPPSITSDEVLDKEGSVFAVHHSFQLKPPNTLMTRTMYIPMARNQATFDCLYCPEPGTAVLFQCTVTRDSYDIKEKGLQLVREGLGIQKIIFIGVVPAGHSLRFVIEKSTAAKYQFAGSYLLEFDPK